MKSVKLVLLLVGLVGLVACQSTPYSPYKADKKHIVSQVKKVGILPAVITVNVPEEASRQQYIEQQLVTEFTQNGFDVVPVSAWLEIYQPLKEAAGQLFDPQTGNRDKAKFDKLMADARAEYLKTYQVDAFVTSAVIPVKAAWDRNSAYWDGAEEAATGKDGFWASFGAPQAHGTTSALSLALTIRDSAQQQLFLEYGGIQLLSRVTHGGFVDVSPEELLQDNDKLDNAVTLATCRFFELWREPVKQKKTKLSLVRKPRCTE